MRANTVFEYYKQAFLFVCYHIIECFGATTISIRFCEQKTTLTILLFVNAVQLKHPIKDVHDINEAR